MTKIIDDKYKRRKSEDTKKARIQPDTGPPHFFQAD